MSKHNAWHATGVGPEVSPHHTHSLPLSLTLSPYHTLTLSTTRTSRATLRSHSLSLACTLSHTLSIR